MHKKIGHFSRSIRSAVFILLFLSAVSALGTFPLSFYRPNQDAHPFIQAFSKITLTLGLDRPWRTPWYQALLALLGMMLVYCVCQRSLELLRPRTNGTAGHRDKSRQHNGNNAALTEEVEVPLNGSGDIEIRVFATLKKSGYSLESNLKDGASEGSMVGTKSMMGVWGATLVHLAFAVILLGGALTHFWGDFRDIELAEGGLITLPGTDTKLMLGKFAVLFEDASDVPSGYASRLFIERPGKPAFWKEVRVNTPLLLDGTKIFQMRYRYEIQTIQLDVYRESELAGSIEIRPGQKELLPGTAVAVELVDFIPDFAIASGGQVTSRTPYFRNPAAELNVYEIKEDGSEQSTFHWAFQSLLEMHEKVERDPWTFVIKKIRKQYVSGLKLSRDPGVPFAYVGFVLLILGTFTTSFVIPRKLFVRIQPAERPDAVKVFLQGKGCRDIVGFRREFYQIVKDLKKIST